MGELNTLRKNKINLEDYNFRQDIENRLLMAQFSSTDLEVLEEILYSSIKIPIKKLAKSVDLEEQEILPLLEKMSKTGLFALEGDSIVVDKEMRKYFETQLLKFDPDFRPGMELLQSLLRKPPIHVLPLWYSIPRTSNNIFDSLVEKYLLSPQIFHRYLMELTFPDPILTSIMNDVMQAPHFKVYGEQIIRKYGLSKEVFEEYILLLEFNFICCLGYEKVGNEWKEIVTPFYEWREYLTFLHNTEPKPLPHQNRVLRKYPHDFSFLHDIGVILNLAKKQPIPLELTKENKLLPLPASLTLIASKCEGVKEDDPAFLTYIERLLAKIQLLKLGDVVDNRLYTLEGAGDFLEMRPENRALFLYRHPLNRLISHELPADLCTERHIREAEKSILRVLNSGWVYLDDFVHGVIVPLGEDSIIMLKKQGKMWKYSIPSYTDEEIALIKATVLDWLFEMGVTAVGTHEGKICFSVTSFGQSLFGR